MTARLLSATRQAMSRLGGQQSSSFFSTAPKPSEIFQLPPNLKIDPRVKSSPVFGAERLQPQKRHEVPRPAAADNDELDSHHESHADIDDDQSLLYDLSTLPTPPHAIPLPHRLHVPILDLSHTHLGTFHLSPRTFATQPRIDILHRCIVYQRNKKRGLRNAGAVTKTISTVSGSGRKVRQQKGLGRSRAGHSRPAHWRGGAKAHGPKGKIQDYTTKLNKKVKALGLRCVLSQKLLEGRLVILSEIKVESHKTRLLEGMLGRFGVGKRGKSGLFVDCSPGRMEEGEESSNVYGGLDVNFKVASSNLPKVKVMNQKGFNVYDALKYELLFLSLNAVRALEERLDR